MHKIVGKIFDLWQNDVYSYLVVPVYVNMNKNEESNEVYFTVKKDSFCAFFSNPRCAYYATKDFLNSLAEDADNLSINYSKIKIYPQYRLIYFLAENIIDNSDNTYNLLTITESLNQFYKWIITPSTDMMASHKIFGNFISNIYLPTFLGSEYNDVKECEFVKLYSKFYNKYFNGINAYNIILVKNTYAFWKGVFVDYYFDKIQKKFKSMKNID
jgi:hypothetical protein